MKRRDIIKGALAGAGAVTTGAATAQAGEPQAAAPAASPAKAAWKPQLFDTHQNETVTTLADLIIPRTDTPGARDAKVNEYIDLILHDGPVERRNRFISGLNWLDGHAIRQHAAPFQRLSSAQQTSILKTLDEARDEELRPGAEFFRQIKQLTVQGYYTSKAGIDELNKGGRVPGSYGCDHKGNH
ncbi:MAG: gluconate 2-dehydrogenase subunit 3 family protein [Bryobacteraceae bacterium]|nr:gluconate 2-dehydrogenase subunit 3 family protein [Bryobacteraceae bacterium]